MKGVYRWGIRLRLYGYGLVRLVWLVVVDCCLYYYFCCREYECSLYYDVLLVSLYYLEF